MEEVVTPEFILVPLSVGLIVEGNSLPLLIQAFVYTADVALLSPFGIYSCCDITLLLLSSLTIEEAEEEVGLIDCTVFSSLEVATAKEIIDLRESDEVSASKCGVTDKNFCVVTSGEVNTSTFASCGPGIWITVVVTVTSDTHGEVLLVGGSDMRT